MTTLPLLDRFVAEGSVPSRTAEIQARLAVVQAQRGQLTNRRSQFLPIEEDAIRILDRPIGELGAEESALAHDAMLLNAGYTELLLDPLRWRNQEGLPSFAIFSIESPECMFRVQVGGKGHGRRFPELTFAPAGLEETDKLFKCFEDVIVMMKQKVIRRGSARGWQIRARFSGVIPEATRCTILKAKELDVFQNIFIISEVDWKIEKIPADPLVTGWDGKKLWLLDKFDATPLEALVAQTFGAPAS